MNWLGFALRFVLRASSAPDPIQGVKHPPNFAQALALARRYFPDLHFLIHDTKEGVHNPNAFNDRFALSLLVCS